MFILISLLSDTMEVKTDKKNISKYLSAIIRRKYVALFMQAFLQSTHKIVFNIFLLITFRVNISI